jgi:hypothetical protein
MGCFRVIINSVQFHSECSILTPKDKMLKSESEKDFSHKISKDFVCIFQIFQFLVKKLKPSENTI